MKRSDRGAAQAIVILSMIHKVTSRMTAAMKTDNTSDHWRTRGELEDLCILLEEHMLPAIQDYYEVDPIIGPEEM